MKVSHGENPIRVIDSLFANAVKPDLVFLDLSSIEYPHRTRDLPWELVEYAGKNPKVKFMWDGNNPFSDDDCYEIVSCNNKNTIAKDFIEKNITFKPHEYIDMTMVSVFYDAGINELRKVATRKAVSHWIEQYHLPKEMMFIELGFNGVFTFSKEDFPEQIDYIRIDGNDSHKYLFQKEHLWNIAAKRAKYEKLMFVDSDIAPLKDVDWFKQVHD